MDLEGTAKTRDRYNNMYIFRYCSIAQSLHCCPQAQAVEAGWVPPPQRPRSSSSSAASAPRATLYSLDSAMASAGGALPTVNEIPGGRGKSLEGAEQGDAAAAEMAVRRGKNRFMKGGEPPNRSLSNPKPYLLNPKP